MSGVKSGDRAGIRTLDLLIKSQLLYQLSYAINSLNMSWKHLICIKNDATYVFHRATSSICMQLNGLIFVLFGQTRQNIRGDELRDVAAHG